MAGRGTATRDFDQAKASLAGGGIASLAAAVLLIRDGGVRGRSIRILEELPVAGGALDGSGDPVRGYVTRDGRSASRWPRPAAGRS